MVVVIDMSKRGGVEAGGADVRLRKGSGSGSKQLGPKTKQNKKKKTEAQSGQQLAEAKEARERKASRVGEGRIDRGRN